MDLVVFFKLFQNPLFDQLSQVCHQASFPRGRDVIETEE